jgi:threonine dehydrogenase-like Zn-dependent dehydrogenase
MKKAVDAIASGVITPDDLYTDVLGLDQLDDAFAMISARPDGFIKALIKIK